MNTGNVGRRTVIFGAAAAAASIGSIGAATAASAAPAEAEEVDDPTSHIECAGGTFRF